MIRPLSCPICKKALTGAELENSLFPFCSERCRRVDLLRWFDGKYAIVEPLDPEAMEESMPEPPLDDSDE